MEEPPENPYNISKGRFPADTHLNSGSQLPHIVFASPNLIFVVGVQKLVPSPDAALARVREYVLPLEDKRMRDVGMGGSAISKLLIFEREPAFLGRKVCVIFVNEKLGF